MVNVGKSGFVCKLHSASGEHLEGEVQTVTCLSLGTQLTA